MKVPTFHGLNSDADVGDLPPGTATACLNVRIEDDGLVKRREGITRLSATRPAHWYSQYGSLAADATEGCLDFEGRLLRFCGTGNVQYLGGSEVQLGCGQPTAPIGVYIRNWSYVAPDETVVLDGGGVLKGWYRYVYTLYDPIHDVEGQPSACSNPVNCTALTGNGLQVYIPNLVGFANFTHVRIYRTRANTDGWFLQDNAFRQVYSKQYYRLITVPIDTVTVMPISVARAPGGDNGWIAGTDPVINLSVTVDNPVTARFVGTAIYDNLVDGLLDIPLSHEVGCMPNGDFAVQHMNRVLVSGNSDHPRRVWWSLPNRPEQCAIRHTAPEPVMSGDSEHHWRWPGYVSGYQLPPREAFVEVVGGGDGSIVGLGIQGGRVVVILTTGITLLNMAGEGYTEVPTLWAMDGGPGDMTVVTSTAAVWLDKSGVWRFDGDGVRDISRHVLKNWMLGIDWTKMSLCSCGWWPREHEAWWSVCMVGDTAPSMILVLNLNRGEFYLHQMPVAVQSMATVGDDLLMLMSNNAVVKCNGSVFDDYGTVVDFATAFQLHLKRNDGGDAVAGIKDVFRWVSFQFQALDSCALGLAGVNRRDTTADDRSYVVSLTDHWYHFMADSWLEYLRVTLTRPAGSVLGAPAFILARVDAEVR